MEGPVPVVVKVFPQYVVDPGGKVVKNGDFWVVPPVLELHDPQTEVEVTFESVGGEVIEVFLSGSIPGVRPVPGPSVTVLIPAHVLEPGVYCYSVRVLWAANGGPVIPRKARGNSEPRILITR